MALSNGRKIIDGSNIMLFINNQSVAHASSHSLSISAETEELNTKDTGVWGMTEVNRITWEITCDHFYTSDGYSTFFDTMMTKTPVQVVFGLKAAAEIGGTPADVNVTDDGYWNPGTPIYSGQAIITSLDWTADAGSKSTFSATLSGQGSITKNSQA